MAQIMMDVLFLKVDVDEVEEVARYDMVLILVINQIVLKYENHKKLFSINCSEYGINCMPTFIFLKNGEKVRSWDFPSLN